MRLTAFSDVSLRVLMLLSALEPGQKLSTQNFHRDGNGCASPGGFDAFKNLTLELYRGGKRGKKLWIATSAPNHPGEDLKVFLKSKWTA